MKTFSGVTNRSKGKLFQCLYFRYKGDIMKYFYLLFCLFFPLNFAIGQSISVGTISKPVLCVGDTVWIPYNSSGSFQADNFFAAQLSDAGGSFTMFTNIGHFIQAVDSIPVIIGNAGDHFRVRVISTDPYTISSDTSTEIHVLNYPSPNPISNIKNTHLGPTAFIGDNIKFNDASLESSGSHYLWSFDQDANIKWTTDSATTIMYSSVGPKSGHLKVTNSAGCSTTKPFQVSILSCNPLIPDSVHVVSGNESGTYQYVWVKAGGNYTVGGQFIFATVFVEAGGSLRTSFRSEGLYYIKNGASFTDDNGQGFAVVILNQGNSITPGEDVLYCSNLQFDYSRVGGGPSEVRIDDHPLQIQNTPNNLRVSCEGATISVSVVNLLGFPIASKTEFGLLNLDLTNFANGVYFAIITFAGHREIRKIAVVH
jgi:hypothetical protein